MGVKDPRRVAAVAWPVVMAGLLLAACGGADAGGASVTTLNLGSTAFATLPPETTTTTIPGAIDETVVEGEQEYVVQSGDYALRVADLFGIPLEDLENYNGWADANSEFPFPGSTIKIPPGAKNLAVAAPPEGVEVVTGGEAEQPVGETIPEAGDNCAPGSYTIEAGDTSRVKVAEKFDVTVEAMDAANATTDGYSSFYPGLKIVIPAKADC